MRDCGKAEFEPINRKCLTCSNNLECVFETAKKRDCPFKKSEGIDVCYSPIEFGCSYDQRAICLKITNYFKHKNFSGCENFGNPKKNPIENCLKCGKENYSNIFVECEAIELQLKNLELTVDEAKRIISREINKMANSPEDCFGEFAFEDTCWNDCEFRIRCMIQSGIIKGEKCKFFPKVDPNILQATLPKLEAFCETCIFLNFCKKELNEKIELIKKEWEEKKLFRTFFSLNEIRTQLIKET